MYSTEYLDFLKKLDQVRDRTIYAKVIALNFQEQPLQQIEGRVTQGSINVDGESAVRRSCSLTLVAQNVNYSDYYWGLNTKFKLEVGIENSLINDPKYSHYPPVIWFKQGIYLITSLNISRSVNNFTMSLQGKDKMCLLNGEVGGSINAPTDFGTIEEDEEIEIVDAEGNTKIEIITVIKKIPIKDILRNAVHVYAGEPYHNIIINDLDGYGLELLEYRYDVPLYAYRRPGDSIIYDNITLQGDLSVTTGSETYALKDVPDSYFDLLIDPLVNEHNPKEFTVAGNDGTFHFAKIVYGNTAGYRETELTYAGDLIANVGDSITSGLLDKIKNMLGEFEYFYDLDGRFIFQKKQALVNTLWTPGKSEEQTEGVEFEGLTPAQSTMSVYEFNNHNLITAFNNTPNLLNMKNDYSVWGERSSINGDKLPVHLRYAIDTKPVYYKTYDGTQIYKIENWDWREIIYQMAIDYYQNNQKDDFEAKIAKNNYVEETDTDYYPTGLTGYEQYYTDVQGFWRQLYCPSLDEYIKRVAIKSIDEDPERDYEQEWKDAYYEKGTYTYWCKDVYEHPEALNFWFDFLDTAGELSQFNVKLVGARTKPVNDTNIKSIYFRETPDLIFVDDMTKDITEFNQAYRYLQCPDDSMFAISAQGKSAKNVLDELIYKHSYCIDSATITAIPVYYLQPNTRIHIYDKDTHLEGDYIISRISIPLTYNGTMSITATKAAETLL